MQKNVSAHVMVVITSMVYVIMVAFRDGWDISAMNEMVMVFFYKCLIFVSLKLLKIVR